MRIINNIIVAFSLYSQIPMPRFEWKEEDMKHNIVFLPWVGAVIGLLSWGLSALLNFVGLPFICKLSMYVLIPLVVTGGFHVDGYMDVQDALKSYKSTEEKLEILKDPHIGAFAIIRFAMYALVWVGAFSVICEKDNKSCLTAYFMIFFIARAVSALSSLKLTHARKNGMLNMETGKCSKADFYVCLIEALIGLGIAAVFNLIVAAAMVIVATVHFVYYKRLCHSQFGGITGDTAGFYITTLEEWFLVAIAVLAYFV